MQGHTTPQRRFYALAALAATLAASPAFAQTQTVPAAPDASGPQTAVPAPRARGADVPGGSSRNGVIRPPATSATTTPVIRPPVRGRMPVIPPPGTGANQPTVQPK